jgi:hypothetical protein
MLRLQIKNALKSGAAMESRRQRTAHFELNMDNVTSQQKKRREAWFRGESETSERPTLIRTLPCWGLDVHDDPRSLFCFPWTLIAGTSICSIAACGLRSLV